MVIKINGAYGLIFSLQRVSSKTRVRPIAPPRFPILVPTLIGHCTPVLDEARSSPRLADLGDHSVIRVTNVVPTIPPPPVVSGPPRRLVVGLVLLRLVGVRITIAAPVYGSTKSSFDWAQVSGRLGLGGRLMIIPVHGRDKREVYGCATEDWVTIRKGLSRELSGLRPLVLPPNPSSGILKLFGLFDQNCFERFAMGSTMAFWHSQYFNPRV